MAGPPSPTAIAERATVILAGLLPLSEEAFALNVRVRPNHWCLHRSVRRVANPAAPFHRCTRGAQPQGLLDRVDAIRALAGKCYLPEMAGLLELGTLVLGEVLRDAETLR